MKWYAVACVLVSLAGVAEMGAIKCTPGSKDAKCIELEESIEPRHGAECLPGTKWTSRCNQCRCTHKGRTVCTEHLCDSEDEFNGEREKLCADNTRWMNGCSFCFCSLSGMPLCSNKTSDCEDIPAELLKKQHAESHLGITCAIGSEWQTKCQQCKCPEGLPQCTTTAPCTEEDESSQKCAPDSYWRKQCNSCWCINGNSLCTTFNCRARVYALYYAEYMAKRRFERDTALQETIAAKDVCASGSPFQSECNNCICADDGKSFKCTHNECMDNENGDVEVFMDPKGEDHIERHSICQPNTTFKVNCNTCVCNDLGTDLTCTNEECPVSDDVELFHELRMSSPNNSIVCAANKMFVKDCNTCWCNELGTAFFCTRKVCTEPFPSDIENGKIIKELKIVKKQCRPDELFEIDCNMCRCNPDGQSFSCTRRACYDIAEPPINKNSPLIRAARASPAQEPPKTCTPGQEFRMDCNTCLCDNEGQDFSCTRIDCNNNNKQSIRKRDVAQQDMSACEPGSVFTQDCNLCQCSADGRHATCTLKKCHLQPAEKEKFTNEVPEVDPNFRCSPGEQFRRECNDCACSADGKSVFCTLRLCDKDLITSKI